MQVDVFEGVEINLHPFASQINDLTAHQTGGASSQRQLSNHLQQPLGRDARATQRHHFKGAGEQGIPSQDRRGIAIHLVVGRPATPQIVVVHGGQIVMDQRHGVDHLQRRCGGQRQLGIATSQLTAGQAKDGP